MITNALNPKFVYLSPVQFDELDPSRQIRKTRFAAHVHQAISGWLLSGSHPAAGQTAPDDSYVESDFEIEFLHPLVGPTTMRVELWVERMNATSCTYGFLCLSNDGRTPYARGEKTILHVDPQTFRPIAWTNAFREHHALLVKDLPAYA